MDTEEIREKAQEEIQTKANELTNTKSITNHTKEEIENTIGLSWTNVAKVYFEDSETIGNINTLKEELEKQEYIAKIDETDGQPCLTIIVTIDLYERLEDK